jgi:hypothetical protein
MGFSFTFNGNWITDRLRDDSNIAIKTSNVALALDASNGCLAPVSMLSIINRTISECADGSFGNGNSSTAPFFTSLTHGRPGVGASPSISI